MRRCIFPILAGALLVALTGCGASGPTQVVVEEQSALTVEPPETLSAEPTPLPRAEVDIEPLRVLEFDEPDTTSPSLPFTALAYDSDELRLRLQDREITLPAPATGETVTATPDTSGGLETGMKGRQQTRTAEVPEMDDDGPGFFTVLGWTAGSIVLILVLILAIRIVG